jgi:hypothetical protein
MYCSAARAGLPINGPIMHVADKRLLEMGQQGLKFFFRCPERSAPGWPARGLPHEGAAGTRAMRDAAMTPRWRM